MKHIFFTAALFFATLPIFSQTVYENAEKDFTDGKEVQYYVNDKFMLIVIPQMGTEYGFKKNPSFNVMVENKSLDRLFVDPTAITATYVDKNADVQAKILTEKEFTSKVKKNILLWGPNNVRTVTTTTNVTQEGNANNGYVDTNTKATTQTEVYTGENSEARAEAAASIQKQYLKKNTLPKGKSTKGLLVASKIKGKKMKLTIPLAGDVYIFNCDFSEE